MSTRAIADMLWPFAVDLAVKRASTEQVDSSKGLFEGKYWEILTARRGGVVSKLANAFPIWSSDGSAFGAIYSVAVTARAGGSSVPRKATEGVDEDLPEGVKI